MSKARNLHDPEKGIVHKDDTATGESDTMYDNPEELVEAVAKDHLDLMLEVCLKIREDKEFAKSIYADCPRLQHLLDQHPDLRPIFEEPNLVRINFEQVYRSAGGDKLPEDQPSRFKKTLACIVTHPLFKLLRFLLFIKKCVNCIMGGGATMLRNCFMGMCCDSAVGEAAARAGADQSGTEDHTNSMPGGDPEADGGSPEYSANRESLYRAADYMEQHEEEMQKLLECEPEQLDEMIEQDPELRALRDSNPLCHELMSDQATMTILIDPDNLRALGECPDLIEADFADPDWSVPDLETGTFDDATGGDEVVVNAAQIDAEGDVEGEGEENEEGFLDEFECGEEEEQEGNAANKRNRSAKRQQQGDEADEDANKQGGGGFFSSVRAGLVDYIASETVGMTFDEIMGGNDGLGGIEDAADKGADDAADAAEKSASKIESLAQSAAAACELVSGDMADNVEKTLDKVEAVHERTLGGEAATIGTVTMIGGGARAAEVGDSDDEVKEKVDDSKETKGLRRISNALGGVATSFSQAAKEAVASALLGEDFGGELVERMEERKSQKEDDDDNKDDDKKKDGEEGDGKRSRREILPFRKK